MMHLRENIIIFASSQFLTMTFSSAIKQFSDKKVIILFFKSMFIMKYNVYKKRFSICIIRLSSIASHETIIVIFYSLLICMFDF